jgi:2-phosphosulfolactate phosphatase
VFALEDVLGAAAVVDAALRLNDPPDARDAARFARDAFEVASRDLPAAVASASHARELAEAGLGEDVAYCARLDVSRVAPVVERGEDGVLRIEAKRLPAT